MIRDTKDYYVYIDGDSAALIGHGLTKEEAERERYDVERLQRIGLMSQGKCMIGRTGICSQRGRARAFGICD